RRRSRRPDARRGARDRRAVPPAQVVSVTAPRNRPEPPGAGPVRSGAAGSMDANDRLDRGAAWMLELQRGDGSAFDRIVAEYQDTVHRMLYRYTGRREGVEDLAQEVFLRVFRARERYRPDAKFQTWLFRIIFNLCVNETKSRRLRRAASLEAGVGST